MKNTKEFYAKLADLMDEYQVAGFYPSCDESVYIELPSNETKYFCNGVEPKYLREEAGYKVLRLGGDIVATVNPLLMDIDDIICVGVDMGKAGSDHSAVVDRKISDIDMAFGKAAESMLKGGNDE